MCGDFVIAMHAAQGTIFSFAVHINGANAYISLIAFIATHTLLRRLNMIPMIFSPFSRWLEKRRIVSELSSLSDEMLRDIGVERGQIGKIAQKAVRG